MTKLKILLSFRFLPAIALAATLLLQCSMLGVDSGFGSETTNGRVIGTVLLPCGSPAVGVTVMARRADYVVRIPSALGNIFLTSRDVITDNSGNFTIDSLDTGSYLVEMNDNKTLAALATCSISHDKKEINVGSHTLGRYSTIKGEINLGVPKVTRYVQVCGLERIVQADSNGSFSLNDLPAGTFSLKVVSRDTSVQKLTVNNVSVAPAAVAIVAPIGWFHSRTLLFNTTPSGANIVGDVYRFPVLVRLTSSNFSFSEARTDGNDLRFSKIDDGTALSYEIERWDPMGGHAELWVKVDTIFGNDHSRGMVLSWGNAGALPVSNSEQVFDTSSAGGFAAVWHLGGNCNDATNNNHDGTSNSASDTIGIIGLSKKFHGHDSVKVSGLLGSPQNITLSAWTQLDTTLVLGAEIISLGDAVLIRNDDLQQGGVLGAVHLSTVGVDTTYYNLSSGFFLKGSEWHHIALSIDNVAHVQQLFVDGVLYMRRTHQQPIDYSNIGQNTFLGKHGTGKTSYYFFGRIDEARVCRVARSENWIKLDYENQKENSNLLEIK